MKFFTSAAYLSLFLVVFVNLQNAKAQLRINVSTISPVCFGDTTGKITVSPSGATGPYTISLINGFDKFGPAQKVVVVNADYTFENLPSNGYSITVSSFGDNCQTVFEFVTLNIPEVYSRYFMATDSTCGPCDSRLEYVVAPADSFTYVWNTGARTAKVSKLCNGQYVVKATHKRTGCSITDSTFSQGSEVGNFIINEFYICQNQEASYELGQYSSDNGVCQNLNPDEITWDFGDGNTEMGSLTKTHTYQNSGLYTVVVTHPQLGVLATAQNIVDAPLVLISNAVSCEDTLSYSFSIGKSCVEEVSGVNPVWNFGDPSSGTNNTSEEMTPTHKFTRPGSYLVTLQYVGITDSVRLNVTRFANQGGNFSYQPSNCQNLLARAFVSEMPCVGVAKWNFGDPASGSSNSASGLFPIHTFTAPGTFVVTLSFTSTNQDTIKVQKTIQIGLPPVLVKTPDKTLIEGDSVLIGPSNTQAFSVFWNNQSTSSPIRVSKPGEYIVTISSQTNDFNCPFSDTILVSFCKSELAVSEEIKNNTELKVWPNPTGNSNAISFLSKGNERFEVLFANGKQVTVGSTKPDSTNINTGFWPKGLYILIVNQKSGETQTARFIVD